jgi:enamine deaminase RidA (YjgF/YER057c/UK114 family)
MDNNTIQTESLNAQEHQQKADKKSIKISIKIAIIIAMIIAVGVLAYIYKGLFIAATVDGSPISRLAIVQELEKASGKDLLDSLITEKLVQNEANAKKIVVSNDEINGKIKNIEDQIVAQGDTLDAALAAQGMSMEDLKKQIIFQKEVEELVADKINVTDEEVAQYIKDNAISIPEGQEATTTAQIKDELRNQKLSTEANALIATLKSQAKIRYFVNY